MNLWNMRSVQPPKKPCTAPATIPIIVEKKVTMKAKKTDSLNPYIILAATSLVWSSVPKMWFLSGGAGAKSTS